MKSYNSVLISTTSALALTVSLSASGYGAEQQAQSLIEEIVVQARRVDENIQDVPLTILAVSEEKLQSLNIQTINSLQKLVPAFSTTAGTRGTYAWLRGLQGIAYYFADAPFQAAPGGQFFDVQNVQVLKGPQGTLFGQASAAGAFVVSPRRPGEVLSGFASATTGSFSRRTIETAIDVPLSDKLFVRFAGRTHGQAGYVTDVATGEKYNDQNEWVARLSVIWRPTERIESYLMANYYYSYINGDNFPWDDVDFNLASPGALIGRFFAALPATPGQPVIPGLPGQLPYLDNYLARMKPSGDLGPYRRDGLVQAQGFSGAKDVVTAIVNHTSFDITDNMTITNLASYRKVASRVRIDAFNGAPNTMPQFGAPSNDPRAVAQYSNTPMPNFVYWSEELKLTGTVFDIFNYTLGTFHTGYTHNPETNWAFNFNSLNPAWTKGDATKPVISRAVYGQTDIDLGGFLEGLKGSLGYRYTWDTHEQTVRRYQQVLVGPPRTDLNTYPGTLQHQKVAFGGTNWLAGLNYELNTDTLLFFTASKGRTNGQVNVGFPAPDNVTFPETLTNLEVGAKSTFNIGDMEIRTNVSAYYGFYKDIQVTFPKVVQINPPPAPLTYIVTSKNAAEGKIRGFDFDVTVVPTEWLELNAAGAHINNIFTRWPILDPLGSGTVIGDRAAGSIYLGSPKWKIILSGTVHVPIPEEAGGLDVTLDWNHSGVKCYDTTVTTDSPQFHPFSFQTAANGYGPALSASRPTKVSSSCQLPFTDSNLNVAWNDPFGATGLQLTFGITNLLASSQPVNTGVAWYQVGYHLTQPPQPRSFFVGARYSF